MTTYLAFDQAPKNTGWAVGTPGDRPRAWGRIKLPSCGKNYGKLMFAMREAIEPLLIEYQPAVVAVEIPFLGKNANVFGESMGFMMGIEYLCHIYQIECAGFTVANWRTPFIGMAQKPRGHKKDVNYLKDKTMLRCRQAGLPCQKYDESDALGILEHLINQRHPGEGYVGKNFPMFS